MATTKLTDREGAVIGKWGTCQGRRVRIWIVRCPEPGCRHQASGVGDQGRVLDYVAEHMVWAHPREDRRE